MSFEIEEEKALDIILYSLQSDKSYSVNANAMQKDNQERLLNPTSSFDANL